MSRPPFATRAVGVVLAVQAVVLAAMSPFYGPHRDELYFVACGQRLAWGYPDQPSLTPLLARLATEVAPHHLTVLRVPALLGAVAISLVGALFARLLGGGRSAQVLTAAVIAASALTMAVGHRLSTADFDTLAWSLVVLLTTQAVVERRPRLWLAAGLVAGIGLNNKHAVVFLVLAVLVACLVDPLARPVLRTRWPWLGGLLALALWLPNLVWQARHGWPAFALTADIAEEYGGLAGRVQLVVGAAIVFSPVIFVVWVIGLVQLLRRPQWRSARLPAIVFLVVTAVFLITSGKGYYLAGAIVPLIAAGCTWLAERWSGRRLIAAGVGLALSAVVAEPALVPLLPTQVYADSFYPAVDSDQPETVGWPGYVDQIRAVVTDLPAGQRRTAVVFTSNYGEAGAAQWYGVGAPVYSGHNGWRFWGPPPETAGPVVVVGYDDPSEDFVGCHRAATLHNRYGLDNDEQGAVVSVCAGPIGGWTARWAKLVHYDA